MHPILNVKGLTSDDSTVIYYVEICGRITVAVAFTPGGGAAKISKISMSIRFMQMVEIRGEITVAMGFIPGGSARKISKISICVLSSRRGSLNPAQGESCVLVPPHCSRFASGTIF